jgi:hypothetical protein
MGLRKIRPLGTDSIDWRMSHAAAPPNHSFTRAGGCQASAREKCAHEKCAHEKCAHEKCAHEKCALSLSLGLVN